MGFNRWALPQVTLDTDTMKLTMVHNSWSLPVFKELLSVGKLADMDFNDAMSRMNMAALHETSIGKALLLFIMIRCAPQLRVAKPDLMKLFGDLMLDKNIAALLDKCNMTLSSILAEYFATKVMLLAFCMRQTSRIPYRLQSSKDKASVDDEPGCRQFDVAQDANDPASFFLYEIYDDEDAFKAHVQSPHFKSFDKLSGPWVKDKKVLTYGLAAGNRDW